MEVYKCAECNSEVKRGTKFCSECGSKLEWPDEVKVAKVKVEKTKKSKRIIKLNVDPLAVDDLYESSAGLAIGILFTNVLLIGIILCPIIFSMRSTLKQWLQHLLHPESYPEVDTSIMVNKAKYIQSCGNAARIMCFIIGAGSFFGLFATPKSTNTYSSFIEDNGNTDMTGWFVASLIISIIGWIVSEILVIKARKVVNSFNSDQIYEFDRDKKYTDADYQ